MQATTKKQSALRATRIAAVTSALLAQRTAAKLAKFASATAAHNQQAYMLAVQQLAAQYGLPVPNTVSARAVSTTQQYAASAVQGACKAVRKWCAANPHATVAQAKQHFSGTNYVNPATVQTQHAVARKQAKLQ